MKALAVLFATILLSVFFNSVNIAQAQSGPCNPETNIGWAITPTSVDIPPGATVTATIQDPKSISVPTQLQVWVEPGIDANGNFQSIADDTIIVGGAEAASLSIPPMTPEGNYTVAIGYIFTNPGEPSAFILCGPTKTLAVTSSYEPPPEGTECLSLGDICAVFRPGDNPEDMGQYTWPLCSPSFTYCKPDNTFGWMGRVTAKGNQQAPCIYNPESEGDKYYCTAGTPGSQDENCICYQEILDRNISTADLVGLGCIPVEGFVNSAIGCVPYMDVNQLTAFFIRWSLGVGGGIALFLISISAIKMMTTKGDPKRLQDARDSFSAGVAGIIFLLLSIFLIRFASETLLQIL